MRKRAIPNHVNLFLPLASHSTGLVLTALAWKQLHIILNGITGAVFQLASAWGRIKRFRQKTLPRHMQLLLRACMTTLHTLPLMFPHRIPLGFVHCNTKTLYLPSFNRSLKQLTEG